MLTVQDIQRLARTFWNSSPDISADILVEKYVRFIILTNKTSNALPLCVKQRSNIYEDKSRAHFIQIMFANFNGSVML